MITARHTIATLSLTSLIVMGACGAKDKAAEELILHGPDKLRSAEVTDHQIEKHLKTETRKVDEVEAEKALAALGLAKSGAGNISWSGKSGKDGTYIFNDVTSKLDDDTVLRIDELKLTGAHMDGEQASFDRLDMDDLTIVDEGETATITLDSLSLAHPDPRHSVVIVESILNDSEGIQAIIVETDTTSDGHLPIGALLGKELKFVTGEDTVVINDFGWAEDRKSKTAMFKLHDLKVDTENDGTPLRMTLESIDMTGLDVDYLGKMRGIFGAGVGGMTGSMSSINPFAKTFEDFSVKNFNLTMDSLSIKSDGMNANSRQQNEITTMYQTLEPVKIGFSAAPKDPELLSFYEALSDMGYESLEFSGSQVGQLNSKTDTSSVTSANWKLKDGFGLKYDYVVSGITEYTNILLQDVQDPDMAMTAMDKLALNKSTITLTDHSLLDRIFKVVAKKQDTSEDMLRMQAKGMMGMMSMAAKDEAEAKMLGQLSSALGDFLEEGGSLTIKLNPETPFSMGSLTSGGIPDIGALGFSASHKSP